MAVEGRGAKRAGRREALAMFDLDTFLSDCLAANEADQPRLAVKEVLERAVADPAGVAEALPPTKAALGTLYVSDELTVLNVVWAPGQVIRPHDHRTWATIGLYSGGEDNSFYRRADGGLTSSGGRELRPKDVCLLGDDTIHGVHNPTTEHAGAIHIYGGNFFEIERSEFDPETHEERPYDVSATLADFEAANAGLT
jgi:predicted metal-dependent enzyme (double-stranded beta helix superfamily)